MKIFSTPILAAWVFCWVFVSAGSASAGSDVLHGGWYLEVPYQYEETLPTGSTVLTGLDIEIMRAAGNKAGFHVRFERVPWKENLTGVREGTLDFGLAATPEKDREEWAWFTVPYRKDCIVAFKRRGADLNWDEEKLPVENLRNLLLRGGSLAVPASYFLGPDVEELLTSREFEGQILRPIDYTEAVEMVVSGRADVFLCDHLSGPGVAWRAGVMDRIEEIPGVFFETDLCIMLSRKRCTSDDLSALNTSLTEMLKSGEIERMMRYHLVPRLLLITLKSRWFEILEIIGTVAFAISGVIIARREQYDVTGAIVLAALPAVGGGVIRDLVSGRSPVGIIQSPQLFLMVIGTAFAGFLFYSARDLWTCSGRPPDDLKRQHSLRWASAQGLLEISDAIGLSTFTVMGVMVAVEQRSEPLWLWGPVFAALTGAGGAVLRDVLRAQADIPSLKGSIYPEIAIVWGFLYSALIISWAGSLDFGRIFWLTIVVLVGIVATRVAVVHLGLRSLFLGLKRAQ